MRFWGISANNVTKVVDMHEQLGMDYKQYTWKQKCNQPENQNKLIE